MHVPGEFGWGEQLNLPKISAQGNLVSVETLRAGHTPSPAESPGPGSLQVKDPSPRQDSGPRAPRSQTLLGNWYFSLGVEPGAAAFHAQHHQLSLEGAAGKPALGQALGWTATPKGKKESFR